MSYRDDVLQMIRDQQRGKVTSVPQVTYMPADILNPETYGCCSECFAVVPNNFQVSHSRWHLSMVEQTYRWAVSEGEAATEFPMRGSSPEV